jgi:hypothetical protein
MLIQTSQYKYEAINLPREITMLVIDTMTPTLQHGGLPRSAREDAFHTYDVGQWLREGVDDIILDNVAVWPCGAWCFPEDLAEWPEIVGLDLQDYRISIEVVSKYMVPEYPVECESVLEGPHTQSGDPTT